jgi:rod shape-determining protein MreC
VVGLLKRYRELILVASLLVLPLGVYFAHAKHPSERTRLDRVILALTGPIEKGIGWTVTGAIETWNGYVGLRGAHARALALQHEVTALKLDQLELARTRDENERLRRLLGFAREVPERRVVGARVVGVRLDPKGLQLVTIDRGSRDGVGQMMPVVVAQGVVGRVHAVTDTTADVLLLSDRNSSIAVRVDRSRARANVRGTGAPDACRLEYALRSDDMQDGDALLTSGTDGVFPRGLPVGRIASLKRSGQGLYQRADVAPAVDVTKIEEVLVLTSFDRRSDEPAGAVAPAPAVASRRARAATPPPADDDDRAPPAAPASGSAAAGAEP